MGKVGGSSLVVLGIFLVIAGWIIGSNIVEGLLDVLKWIMVTIGIVAGIIGIIQMMSGSKSSSGY